MVTLRNYREKMQRLENIKGYQSKNIFKTDLKVESYAEVFKISSVQ